MWQRELSLYQKRQNQIPANKTPKPTNRKQGPDKNTILFAAAASIIQVAEGHALSRKCGCFWRGEVAEVGGRGGVRRWGEKWATAGSGGRVLCLPHSLAGKEIEPNLPAPLLATTSGSTLDIHVFLPLLPGMIRLLLWELNDCSFQHTSLTTKPRTRDQQTASAKGPDKYYGLCGPYSLWYNGEAATGNSWTTERVFQLNFIYGHW